MSCKLVIFKTAKEKREGVSKKNKIDSSTAYFFPNVNTITMAETNFPIKIIFTDENYKILDIKLGKPKSKKLIVNNFAKHVFETALTFDVLNKYSDLIQEHEEELNAATGSQR